MCRCGSYPFPHRMLGGHCEAGYIVTDTWEKNQGGGECRDCMCFDKEQHLCEVIDGREPTRMCPVWLDFLRYEGVKTYGKDKPPIVITSRLIP